MLNELKKQVFEANLSLVDLGLVLFTWGNVSGCDKETGYIVIKPSGIPYYKMKYTDMVVIDSNGKKIEGKYNPSSDAPTHIELYKNFAGIGAVAHTHSKWATIFSQAVKGVPALGTTHADNFYGEIPVTRPLSRDQVLGEYEKETGLQIVETFKTKGINPIEVQGVVVANHAPFTWGESCRKAVENSAVLEYIAEMAYYTLNINPQIQMSSSILDKHYLRKHGINAYYGQKDKI